MGPKRKRKGVPILIPKRESTAVKPYHDPVIENNVFSGEFVSRDRDVTKLPLIAMADVIGGRYPLNGFQYVVTSGIKPDVTMHIFQTSKFITCGAIGPYESRVTLERIRMRIRMDLNIRTWIQEYGRRNTVVAYAVGYGLDLHAFYRDHDIDGQCAYETDLYPGLNYFPNFPDKVPCVILHESGAINIVATTSLEAAKVTFDQLRIQRYRIDGPPVPKPRVMFKAKRELSEPSAVPAVKATQTKRLETNIPSWSSLLK